MLNEQQFEELLQIVIPEVCYEEICEIEEQMLKEGKHVFSEEFEKNMESVFKGKKSIVNDITATKIKTKLKFKYLLVAILLFILSSITVMAYEPARHALKEFFFTIYDEYLVIFSQNIEKEENLESKEKIFLKPTYVPDEYELIDESFDETLKYISLIWVDTEGTTLYYEQTSLDMGGVVLSSDGNEPINIMIGDMEGKLVAEEDGTNTVFYEKEDFLFIASGCIGDEELIQMLLSIE